jgi:hypothetical protein
MKVYFKNNIKFYLISGEFFPKLSYVLLFYTSSAFSQPTDRIRTPINFIIEDILRTLTMKLKP